MKNWIKLEECNNWGAVYYVMPGKKYDQSHTLAPDNELKLYVGMQLDVRFPDGEEGRLTLDVRKHQTDVSDCGRSYPVTQEHYGFVVRCHEIDVFVPITSVEVLKEQMPATRGSRY